MEPDSKEQMESERIEKQTLVEADYQSALARWKKLQARVDEAGKLQSQTMFPLGPSRVARFQRLKDQLSEAQAQVDVAFQRRLDHGSSSLSPFLALVERDEARSHELQKLSTELSQKLNEAEALRKEVEKKPPPPSVDPVTQDVADQQQMKKEIKELHDTLKEVSERVSNVENSQSAQEGEVREMLQAYFYDCAQGETKNIETQLSELSTWVDEARVANARIEGEQKALIEEKDKEDADIRDLLARVEEHEKNHTKDKNEIEALSAALSAYREKPVSPPSSPFDPETIVLDMEDQIKTLVQNAIRPQIEDSRSTLTEDLKKHDSELFTTLWSKLSLTHKVIAAVTEATKQPPAS
ncbi:hypothetical protein BT96DRAFT_992697 [Gymnopus androsaceus JB14]|uniref:Uncharacterized protein n=1 Tax=Gymnopus androsaceus JB14 TaxID=1447944 RepID=A0A6A4HPA7_9AGAR|nr:hypothetical protein BT96DRAFT_992697 [Gymnopus androsaceus JB14]